ncbi:MAG TPA: N-6 DNA methylase [Bryobacteraceae bacterium]|nr:N-6 DNA methylase [Bryobacteraceae bacterium]
MSDSLDVNTKQLLAHYLVEVRALPNESAKTHRFVALVGQAFPGSAVISKLTAGIEKAIRIQLPERAKRGRIDSYFGNAVIEFEYSLKTTGEVAEHQLREYCAGVWTNEGRPHRPLLAVASDGVVWKTYRPSLPSNLEEPPQPGDVTLELLRELNVTDSNLFDFYLFLNTLLFRTGQVVPSAEQFRQDFGRESLAYGDSMETLAMAWRRTREEKELDLAFRNWQRYLAVTYGSLPAGTSAKGQELTELEELFLKHTYLASVARLMIWASLSLGKSEKSYADVAEMVLSGEYFRKSGLANLVEDDFFQWIRSNAARRLLRPVWERIIAQIETYDLSRLDQDVLKGVYQELVDPKDRHDLGEYYTPDWLCERIVAELLPKSGYVKVLDPACGSGSFLRAAIAHFLEHNPAHDSERLQRVLEHVVGIEVHPLAVSIAKATYVLALGTVIQAAKRPVSLPVYMADSLFLPSEVRQMKLGEAARVNVRFAGKEVLMPQGLITSPDLFDPAIDAASQVALDHAKSGTETRKTLEAYLLRAAPTINKHDEREPIITALWEYSVVLAQLIRDHDNSIWAFIIRNSYRPAMLRQRFDVIVGNPPWLSYRYIADPDYQAEIKKRAVEEYRIAPNKQKLMTQMELATVFVAHSMGWFAADGARLGFVMPRSILSGDQHENLRLRKYSWRCRMRLTGYWDMRHVTPLFNVPACVLFAQESADPDSPDESLPVKEWSGKLSERDCPWAVARKQLSSGDATGRVIYLAKRSALSTSSGNGKPGTSSAYAKSFGQGATIVPRCFYFVRSKLTFPVDQEGLYWAETDPEQLKLGKKPWDDVQLSGQVEGRFFHYVVLAGQILPFTLLRPSIAVIPLVEDDSKRVVWDATTLRRNGYREFGHWVEEAERIWEQRREKKAGSETLIEWLDYQGKLTAQRSRDKYIVLYNKSGTNVSAVGVRKAEFALPLVIDHTVYSGTVSSAEEADYLTSLLNSSLSNEAIKPFQAMGLLGERDIHKKLLDLPIPRFKPEDSRHVALARLGRQARERIGTLLKGSKLPTSLARQRGWAREQVKNELAEIDQIVKKLL